MSSREVVDWRVPEDAWSNHHDEVRDEHGDVDGSLGRVTERAMQEYAEIDRYASVEDRVDMLLDTSPGTSDAARTKKKDTETQRVTVRVHPDIKQEFKRTADDDDRFRSYGHALAHAVSVYHDGGRAGRLKRKVDKIIEAVGDGVASLKSDVANSEEEVDEDVQEEEEDRPDYYDEIEQRSSKSNKRDRLMYVCDELSGGEFTDDELESTIKRSGVDSPPTVRTYRETVTEVLGMVKHPSNDTLWVSEEMANEIVGEGVPEVCRKPVPDLSRSEKLRRMKIEAGRRALEESEKHYIVDSNVVTEEILNGEVSDATARSLVKEVCEDRGFNQTSRDSSTTFRFNSRKVADTYPSLTDTIRGYVNDDGTEDSDTNERDVDDPDSADEKVDQLSHATPVTGD